MVFEKVDGHAGLITKEATRIRLQVFKNTHKFRTFSYRLLVHGPNCLWSALPTLTADFYSKSSLALFCVTDYMHHYDYFSCISLCNNYYNMQNSEFTIRNANKVKLLKPEERGWRWTELYPRATHQGTSSTKTKIF